MYGSPANSKDLNLRIPAASINQGKEESDLGQNQQQQEQQMSSGLLRYRSAPSSLLGEMCESFFPHRSSTGEAETMFTRFMSPDLRDQIGEKSSPHKSIRFLPEIEREVGEASRQQNGGFHSSAPHVAAYHASGSPAALEGSYRVATSTSMESERESSGTRRSVPIRQSSSPASLFSLLSAENDFSVLSGIGGFRSGNCSNGEPNPSSSRMKGQISFSSRHSSSSSLISQISEIGGEAMAGSSPEDGGRCFIPGLPVAAWDDPPDGFSIAIKRPRDPSEAQIGEAGSGHIPTLAHHFNLPKTSSEMAAVLQFQDAIPCKIRAKRGCATHPRSIAERIRRTRISERIRRLQELVPNMDKQTNTADMLDFAVEYIRELEEQVKSLSETKTNCTCSASKEKP
ncbi:unnamed protein product [Spirodela intermedia]|uniref:BHLH domain-containing protein n=1 Tax=Spirodela intermedia TaxID=51605 RepID=A0A7I8IUB3_SPIIN|nr:unnamed protein product [Spirodela intermedia]CAA6661586.1 unnamed protein product [Spirodela intermedia]